MFNAGKDSSHAERRPEDPTATSDFSAVEAVRSAVRLELIIKAVFNALVGVGVISEDAGSALEGIALSSGDFVCGVIDKNI